MNLVHYLKENADFEYVDVWSSRYSWGDQDPPKEGEMVVIDKHTIILDESTAVLKLLMIKGMFWSCFLEVGMCDCVEQWL